VKTVEEIIKCQDGKCYRVLHDNLTDDYYLIEELDESDYYLSEEKKISELA